MTKSTLNNLWLAGGGLLATWLAVTPNTAPPVVLNHADTPRAVTPHVHTMDDLSLRETNVRSHAGNVPFRPSSRNPFRFGKAITPAKPHSSAAAPAIAAPETQAPAAPALSLAGIATDGLIRTAIISGGGQLYLVKESESVAERYRVVKIEGDAVTLQDANGAETRLALH